MRKTNINPGMNNKFVKVISTPAKKIIIIYIGINCKNSKNLVNKYMLKTLFNLMPKLRSNPLYCKNKISVAWAVNDKIK